MSFILRLHCGIHLFPQIHPVSERRQVCGRSKTFDLLLEEHRKKRKIKKLNKLRAEAGLSQMTTPPDHGSPVRLVEALEVTALVRVYCGDDPLPKIQPSLGVTVVKILYQIALKKLGFFTNDLYLTVITSRLL